MFFIRLFKSYISLARQRYFKKKQNEQNTEETRKQQREKPQSSLYIKQCQSTSRQDVTNKDQRAQRSHLLELAMNWDCIDVAKELILENSLHNILVISCFFSN
jgi:nitrate/TMAO reductase-like tetraheme cytochrome c subunit